MSNSLRICLGSGIPEYDADSDCNDDDDCDGDPNGENPWCLGANGAVGNVTLIL